MYTTDMYEGMIAETITIRGHGGDVINAYLARPLGPGPYPAMVLAHHMPGWDEWYREATRKFAHHGYVTICPDLYHRTGHGTPDDVAAKIRSEGGVADDQAVGDLAAAMEYVRSLPNTSGKVGGFGTCSGGRHVLLAASQVEGFRRDRGLLGRARGHAGIDPHAADAGGAHRLHGGAVVSGARPVRRGGQQPVA